MPQATDSHRIKRGISGRRRRRSLAGVCGLMCAGASALLTPTLFQPAAAAEIRQFTAEVRTGVQIYDCTADAQGATSFVFRAPRADLQRPSTTTPGRSGNTPTAAPSRAPSDSRSNGPAPSPSSPSAPNKSAPTTAYWPASTPSAGSTPPAGSPGPARARSAPWRRCPTRRRTCSPGRGPAAPQANRHRGRAATTAARPRPSQQCIGVHHRLLHPAPSPDHTHPPILAVRRPERRPARPEQHLRQPAVPEERATGKPRRPRPPSAGRRRHVLSVETRPPRCDGRRRQRPLTQYCRPPC
jgi:hypothetical protein